MVGVKVPWHSPFAAAINVAGVPKPRLARLGIDSAPRCAMLKFRNEGRKRPLFQIVFRSFL
jgi:hypothetical protein